MAKVFGYLKNINLLTLIIWNKLLQLVIKVNRFTIKKILYIQFIYTIKVIIFQNNDLYCVKKFMLTDTCFMCYNIINKANEINKLYFT